MMKLLFLCLGLTLVCAHVEGNHHVMTSNIDMSKLSGEFYTILLAANVKEVIQERGDMRVFLNYVEVFHNSSLELKCHVKINGECVPVTLIADKTSENAVYSITYPAVDRIHIVEAVYDDYMIIHMFNSDSNNTYFELGLYARTPEESPEVKEEFTRVVQKYGVPKGNILDLTKTDRCLQARGNQEAQDSRLVMSDGEGLAQGSLPSGTLGVDVQGQQ